MYPTPYGYPPPVQRRTNGLAITSLILGIASWVILPLVAAVAAVIFGHIAQRQVKQSGEDGQGLALAGLILGWLNIALTVLTICFFGVFVLGCFGIVASSGGLDPSNYPTYDPSPTFESPTPFDTPTPAPTS